MWGGGGGSATRDLGTSGARDLGHRGDRLFSEGLLAPAWRASPQRCRVDVRVSIPFPGCHVMSLRNPWTPEGLFSSLIHNRPESGSESRFRRGRWMDENIAHADGRIAPPDKGRRLRTRGQPRARRGPPVTRGRARRGRTHTGSPSSRMQTRGADAVPGPGGRGSTHRTPHRRLPQGAPRTSSSSRSCVRGSPGGPWGDTPSR